MPTSLFHDARVLPKTTCLLPQAVGWKATEAEGGPGGAGEGGAISGSVLDSNRFFSDPDSTFQFIPDPVLDLGQNQHFDQV